MITDNFIITAYFFCGGETTTCVSCDGVTDERDESPQQVFSVEQTVFDNLLFSLYTRFVI